MKDSNNILHPEEEKFIAQEFQGLLDDYLASPHRKKVDIVTRAFQLAKDAHSGARRRSGEPYIIHPIAVARIVAKDMGLGSTSICAALLHDVVEDTEYTVEDIANLFSERIAMIVDGLTKISGGKFGEQASLQAENFRRLLLTMSSDIRVILIKIADRLHNMRTLDSMLSSKQYKIAGETRYLYAPLAHRLGLYTIKTELENLSFKYENTEAFNEVSHKLAEGEAKRNEIFERFSAPIVAELERKGIQFELKVRQKSVYSIWNKMQTKKVAFEEVFDIFAGRIIFEPREGLDETTEAWNVYNAVTDVYSLHPERTRDWLKQPKANGYQALHVTAMGPDGKWIEIQIRSRRMNEIAEKGFAAHFNYKQHSDKPDHLEEFLQQIREILEHPEPNTVDLLDYISLNLFASEIIVFTPKGEMKTLPQGATALDFAFNLHTNIGLQAIGAKVNHRLVPISYVLQSGDQVEILTSRSQHPRAEWLKLVTSGSARARIMYALRKEDRETIGKGEIIYKHFIASHFKEAEPDQHKIIRFYKLGNREELFRELGANHISLDDQLINFLTPKVGINNLLKALRILPPVSAKEKSISTSRHDVVIDKKQTFLLQEKDYNIKYSMQPCCHAIPGDVVLGYFTSEEHLEIHRQDCSKALRLKSSFGNRIISTQWEMFAHNTFPITLTINGLDEKGVLSDVIHILTKELSANIRKINIETNEGVFKGEITIEVHNTIEVNRICELLRKISAVKSVQRL